ncbi:MAG: hypothetical protein EXR92_01055 [Gemmatimonadetes bacterium]|nr:hypothetical protein [Gemmatimonadota bacterium]
MPMRSGTTIAGVLLAAGLGACSSELPPPQTRSVIIYSGQRITADPERMGEVDAWLRPALEDIDVNPSFLIRMIQEDTTRYPWDALELVADTAEVKIARTALDAETPYMIYAYLRLRQERGTLEELVPEAVDLAGFALEKAIVNRVADVWLLGRSAFDTQPFGPVDEILYAREFGYLEDLLLATQAARFPEAVEEYRERNPGKEVEFRDWFLRTFERDGPGYLRPPGEVEPGTNADDPAPSPA